LGAFGHCPCASEWGRWSDSPPVYGPKKTIYNRFVRWAKRGIQEGNFSALAGVDGFPDRVLSSEHAGIADGVRFGVSATARLFDTIDWQ
jgi:hypothetical protein